MKLVDFSIDLLQKLEIGEAFISSTRQDLWKNDKIVEDLQVALHAIVPECQLDPNTPITEKYKTLISSLGSHAKKIRKKYEKDLANDREIVLQEFKTKCDTSPPFPTYL